MQCRAKQSSTNIKSGKSIKYCLKHMSPGIKRLGEKVKKIENWKVSKEK